MSPAREPCGGSACAAWSIISRPITIILGGVEQPPTEPDHGRCGLALMGPYVDPLPDPAFVPPLKT
jgi:hypothetical protein